MGQQLRLGLWRPGDPLPASLREMLAYFASRGVRPVAYVYPILAFLAHTLPGGASPEWIVEGTYWLYDSGGRRPPLHLGNAPGKGEVNGPLRASLADPSFQQWLAKTLVDFASSTGAGGFSFGMYTAVGYAFPLPKVNGAHESEAQCRGRHLQVTSADLAFALFLRLHLL